MNLSLKKCRVLASAVVIASCSGCGGTLFTITSLPGFKNQRIDVYETSGADKAIVFLHGAGGTNYGIAHDLGLNLNDGPPSDNTINWTWLSNNKVLAVFPQGQAASPGGTATWSNHVMTSGQDDVAFLQALATRIRTRYGISRIYLAGHSNGGMMVNRMWCESPDTFAAYISFAGPASDYYLSHPCSPSIAKPYYGVVGSEDTVLQTSGGWTDPTWTINPLYVSGTSPGAFIDPILIGEWSQQQARIDLMGCGERLSGSIGSTTITANGSVTLWSNCGGNLELERVSPANHWIYYEPGSGSVAASDSLESIAGTNLIDLTIQFITAIGQ